ncbi:pseudouridine synthase [Chytriomyces sp. MP71]|nr:pseudouridine synthase [Chytriomyces sp. MP71]
MRMGDIGPPRTYNPRPSRNPPQSTLTRQFQVLSVEIADDNARIPSVEALNAVLPESVRIFKIVAPTGEGFSARRSCEARTYEYLIPTYAFMAPQRETGFDLQLEAHVSKDDLDNMYPDADPESDRSGRSSLFTTLKRQLSRSRSRGRNSTLGRTSSSNPEIAHAVATPEPVEQEKTGFFGSLGRKKSLSRTNSGRRPSWVAGDDSSQSSAANLLGTGANKAPTPEDSIPQFFDPISLPHRNPEKLRSYRITEEQLDMVRTIVAIFRGTHNWHNYVPGADADDQRCFMRIINIESGSPELHGGMEWIRVKAQTKAMARYQFRRMMALMILVVRTNTPRSLIANSFGINKIEIPNAPALGLIFHQPAYAAYNESTRAGTQINFDEEKQRVESFRRNIIHEQIYAEERESLYFEEWLRGIDQTAFLYKHYLNARGLISPQNAYLREGGSLEQSMYNMR